MQNANGTKIKSLEELSDIVSNLKRKGRVVIQCHGVFDLVHPGHIRHLEAAKREGDVLLVTLTQDKYVGKGPGRPIFNHHLRAESLAALECVDYVAINEGPIAIEAIKKLRPDVYAKGNEYADIQNDLTGKISDEAETIKSVGGRIHFTDEITFSSTSLVNNHFEIYSEDARNFLMEMRKKYTSRDIISRLQELNKTRVLVVGDSIIDEYHYCSPMGKSPKELLIPARYLYEESFTGGILAVANHIAGFCNDVHLVTLLGSKNSRERFIRSHLKSNVEPTFFYRPGAPTTQKRRFVEVDLLRKMFEVCYMDNGPLPESVKQELCNYLNEHIDDYDLVVVADYGHGFLDRTTIDFLCEKAKFLAINVQTNSANIGFNLVTKYNRADFLCLDEAEIRFAAHDNVSHLEDLLVGITDQLGCHHAVVTMGHLGSLVYANSEGFLRAPVFSREAIDRIGAGDAFFSITSPCVAARFPPDLIGFVGNTVGALAIRIVGNRTAVEPIPLFRYITTLLK